MEIETKKNKPVVKARPIKEPSEDEPPTPGSEKNNH